MTIRVSYKTRDTYGILFHYCRFLFCFSSFCMLFCFLGQPSGYIRSGTERVVTFSDGWHSAIARDSLTHSLYECLSFMSIDQFFQSMIWFVSCICRWTADCISDNAGSSNFVDPVVTPFSSLLEESLISSW